MQAVYNYNQFKGIGANGSVSPYAAYSWFVGQFLNKGILAMPLLSATFPDI